MTFKEKLVKLRKLKGLTQDELASAVGVSRQAVYKWESGQSYPEVPKLVELKLIFGISIDDLLDENYEVVLPEKKKRKRLTADQKKAIESSVEAEEAAPAPVVDEPVAPVVDEPVAPVVDEPVAPVVEEPAAPVVDEPAAPVVDEPAAPVVDEPAAPVADEPAAPEADEPKKKGFFARLFGNK